MKSRMKLSNLRFKGYDRYDFPVFIARNNDNEMENYNKLSDMSYRLMHKEIMDENNKLYENILPFFKTDKYITLKFCKNGRLEEKYIKNHLYDIEFYINASYSKNKDDKVYLNFMIENSKYVKSSYIIDNMNIIDIDYKTPIPEKDIYFMKNSNNNTYHK